MVTLNHYAILFLNKLKVMKCGNICKYIRKQISIIHEIFFKTNRNSSMERWTKVKKRDKEMQMANKIRSGDIHPHLVLFQWESSNYLFQWESSNYGSSLRRPRPPPRCEEMLVGAEIVITFPEHTYLSFDSAV